ncbi:hypothetical protein TUBRATIS_12140 [Tubulinosema ratisbonensis]|uniref:Uncharacterized protein n=1 Tax=Tubulinosema ratisbonensis TaxID=291195 RepID=A0A437AMN9_9MICR|nr:hypothetical protein TUBRATIS_12140 [Tubulinosema ratisbonensis]
MHIEINLFESKEVTISQIKKEKKRPGDQYDFNDPMFEKLPDEDQYVKIEPILKDFRIINSLTQNKTPDKKEKNPVSYLDTIYAQQNQIYAKIKENTFNEEDMFSFLIYDLMINHDLQFKKLKSKFLHFDITKFCCEEFLTKIFQNFVYARSKLREQLSKLGSQEETYKDENIVFSDQICDTICKYIDTLCLTRCFESEVIKKKAI